MSILNVTVSCFRSYKNAEDPKPINLLTWLKSEKYRDQVLKIRSLSNKQERDQVKATLPAITPSGEFSRRNIAGLIKHSGFICLDIDQYGNEHLGNFTDLKIQLSKFLNVAYCGLSVSGTGYFVLIPIANPERHREHFEALEQDFSRFGIKIDSACKDVARLRGYSYDKAPFFRHTALPYTKLKEQITKTTMNLGLKPASKGYSITTNQEALTRVTQILEKKGIRYGGANSGHEFRMRFAWYCNLYGVPLEYCKTHVFAHYPPTDGLDDFSNCYHRSQHLFGSWRG